MFLKIFCDNLSLSHFLKKLLLYVIIITQKFKSLYYSLFLLKETEESKGILPFTLAVSVLVIFVRISFKECKIALFIKHANAG